MKISSCPTSACRYCHHYQVEGRRGGTCQQLGVPVQGTWKACALGQPAFSNSQNLWQRNIVNLEHALGLEYATQYSQVAVSQGIKVNSQR